MSKYAPFRSGCAALKRAVLASLLLVLCACSSVQTSNTPANKKTGMRAKSATGRAPASVGLDFSLICDDGHGAFPIAFVNENQVFNAYLQDANGNFSNQEVYQIHEAYERAPETLVIYLGANQGQNSWLYQLFNFPTAGLNSSEVRGGEKTSYQAPADIKAPIEKPDRTIVCRPGQPTFNQ